MYRIFRKERLNPTVTLMEIEAERVAKKAEPGQFIILRVNEDGERIPLTVADFDREKGTVTIIFQVVGATTKLLDSKKEGEYIEDFVGPLGTPTRTDGLKKVAIIGGGVGSETGSYNDDNWNYNPKNRTDEALNRVTEVFTELADEAEKNNTFIAIEGAAGHVCYDVKTLKKALDAINRDNVKVIFDLFNYMDEGNQHNYLDILDEGIKTFGDKILLFHMKDCKFNKNGAPEFVPYGEGEMDLKEILKRIKAHNKDAILTLEDTTGEYIKSGSKLIREIWETV